MWWCLLNGGEIFYAHLLFYHMDELSLTPYYNEDVLYSKEELKKENDDGITTLFYLQKIYPDILSGHRTSDNHKDLREGSQALADLKFTYIVSCQRYGAQKKSSEARDRSCYSNILNLMYPSLRVAYIDEREEPVDGKRRKNYYSVLVKGGEKLDECFITRLVHVQSGDKFCDHWPTNFGEPSKTTTVIKGGTLRHQDLKDPRCSLRVRFHYGHPDIFDRIFHITRGGISKASKIINLSEDIFSGYNSTLRGGYVTHHEYIQVGKGRDVGTNQISLFEAEVANGHGEQTLSCDVYRLERRFDFYRMLSFYFTTVGFYFSSMVTVLTVYVFLYGRLYLVLSGMEKRILEDAAICQSKALEEALATQSVFQLGLLLVLPMVMEIGLEKGFRTALGDFVIMRLQLAYVFFTFHS
ncbi:hypothetical protein ACSBR1_008532 [Camellia fascicularis]